MTSAVLPMLTKHAMARCRSRKVPPELAVQAVLEGKQSPADSSPGTAVYRLRRLRVVVSLKTGKIITVWREEKPSPKRKPNKFRRRQALRRLEGCL